MSQESRSKPVTRRTVLSRRDAMAAEERAAGSARIAERTSELLIGRVGVGELVALYCAKGSEVDTAELDARLRRAGLKVAYPRVGAARELTFHAVERAQLEAGRFGLCEPRAGVGIVEPSLIAAVVVPGLAFDAGGARVGWGRGHYDATLRLMPRAWRVGLAFECQMVDEVASEEHDVRMNVVVTEVATHVAA